MRDHFDINVPHLIVGLIAIVALPLTLGIRHVNPMLFMHYSGLAGGLFTVGEWVTLGSRFDWAEFLADWWIRAVAIFLLGGMVYILGFLLF